MSTQEPWSEGQVVLILCGLVASGKSTFATQLQQHYPQFHRCNQDDLGDRRQVERLARDCLARGQSVCIDRTNFNSAQRSYWIQIADEFPGTSIWVIVFDTPYEVCAARLRTRTSHPTIKDAEQGLYVLSRFAADFERPTPNEGIDRLIALKPEDTPLVYSASDIAAILHKIHSPPPVSEINSTPSNHASQSFKGWQSARGNSRRGYSPRSYPSTSYQNVSRGRGFSSSGVTSNHSTWRRPLENTSMRGAGHPWGNSSHFRPSNPHMSSPQGTPGSFVQTQASSESAPEAWRFRRSPNH